jgi:capsular exopolysaccharide synthesis family protein
LLGLAAVFLREWTDDTVHTGEETAAAGRTPVLALIPKKRFGVPGRWPRIDETGNGTQDVDALADAFGSLRTAVLFNRYDPAATGSILVSSCRAGEGKTTVTVNLALSLARLGSRVLVIDGDLRRPSVHRALGVSGRRGLLQVLQEDLPWEEAVRPSGVARLDVLPAGGSTTAAGDLLTPGDLRIILRRAEERYDFVIVDAPAFFINAPDARILSQLVSGVVVVVRSGSTPRSLVQRIPDTVPNVIGVVVNDLLSETLPGHFREYFEPYHSLDMTAGAGLEEADAGTLSGEHPTRGIRCQTVRSVGR